jgi:hypothetical protein
MPARSLDALAWIVFPTRPGHLPPWDADELGYALAELGADVRRGRLAASGSAVIPYPRRSAMRVELEVQKADGGKFWDLTMNYYGLPPRYALEIAGLGSSYANMVENTPGGAVADDPAYTVSFKLSGDDVPDIAPIPQQQAKPNKPDKGINAKAEHLAYSQMKALQDAGISFLANLQTGATYEIASGQRK